MGKVIGIDLGTTNSCVTIVEQGNSVVIPNNEGSRITPSTIMVAPTGERLVGHIAKRQSVINPETTVHAVKRLMGRRFDSDEVGKIRESVSYQVVQSDNGDAWVRLHDKDFSPAELSGMVLRHMRDVAAEFLGEEVSDAVVTVPAYFDDAQRQATRDAGRIAGLNVLRIINEPTAAALAYGLDNDETKTIAVYDLGGGTLDISILELGDGVFEVKATSGATFLGGEDFDNAIINFLVAEFKTSEGVDLRKDRLAMQRLREAAEKAKHELSTSMETEINLSFIYADANGPKHLNLMFTRRRLEELVEELVQDTLTPCRQCIQDAGLTVDDIDDVLLVGGMTRMPRVQQVVSEFFKKQPNLTMNPDEVVAIGAAIQGGILKGEVEEALLLDVTPLSLGVETMGGMMTKIIERNTPIPVRESQVFTTAQDNQSLVNVHVLQGEREMGKDNRSLARFQLVGIPAAPRGVPQIEVTFAIDANGIVNVSAKDLGTGREQRVEVVASGGLGEEEVQRLLNDAETARDEDRLKKDLAELKNGAAGLIYTTERSLQEYSQVLETEDVDEIRSALKECKLALDSNEGESIRIAMQALERCSYKIAEAMYSYMGVED